MLEAVVTKKEGIQINQLLQCLLIHTINTEADTAYPQKLCMYELSRVPQAVEHESVACLSTSNVCAVSTALVDVHHLFLICNRSFICRWIKISGNIRQSNKCQNCHFGIRIINIMHSLLSIDSHFNHRCNVWNKFPSRSNFKNFSSTYIWLFNCNLPILKSLNCNIIKK